MLRCIEESRGKQLGIVRVSSRCYPKIIVWMMSLSMCILWLPVIWLSRRVFPYVSVFKHGGSHPLWSCCLLGKFLWTKISELPKVISIQEILVDVGFEYKCKSWILAALYNPAFCYWFCSPNLYWSRNNTTTWNDSEGIFLAFFFAGGDNLQAFLRGRGL